MKLLRFGFVALCAYGIGACAYAGSRLLGIVPPGKLPLYPDWAGVHLVTATAFVILAPLQLWPALRARNPRLHRHVGRAAVSIGAVMAASGLALVYASPDRPVSERIFMTTFFLAYLAMLALGFRAALRRDIATHRAWMLRMTATAITPVTQRVMFPAFAVTLGIDGLESFWQIFVSVAWIAWAFDMAVAEALIHGQRRAPRLAPTAA
jgi:uncharacterized membrane protein